MKSRVLSLLAVCLLVLGVTAVAFAQQSGGVSELSVAQRLDVLTSKLESMRRSLNNAISSMAPAAKSNDKATKVNPDDPVVRLKGLEKEASSLTSEVNDIRTKNDIVEKFQRPPIDPLVPYTTETRRRI